MSFISTTQYGRFYAIPIALPQTELRRLSYIQVASIPLALGQTLELNSLYLHLLRILTPGVEPDAPVTGLASVGLLASTMTSSAIAMVNTATPGVSALNSDQPVVVTAPGTYKIIVFNNCSNVDLAMVVTGTVWVYS